jgi:hypothetical protein
MSPKTNENKKHKRCNHTETDFPPPKKKREEEKEEKERKLEGLEEHKIAFAYRAFRLGRDKR